MRRAAEGQQAGGRGQGQAAAAEEVDDGRRGRAGVELDAVRLVQHLRSAAPARAARLDHAPAAARALRTRDVCAPVRGSARAVGLPCGTA